MAKLEDRLKLMEQHLERDWNFSRNEVNWLIKSLRAEREKRVEAEAQKLRAIEIVSIVTEQLSGTVTIDDWPKMEDSLKAGWRDKARAEIEEDRT